ncbi:MAG: TIGR03985 family CRISPR-associated protein [Rivularia sp. (in: cyanobacteria)]
MKIYFDNLPYPKLLQNLAKGSLDQIQNLSRAIRLWALLRWIYSEEGYTALGDCFTYTDWRKAFFTQTHKDEKQQDILSHEDTECNCIKTTQQWLIDLQVSIDEWQQKLLAQIPIAKSDIEQLLSERLFAQVRKSLQSDLDLLVSRNLLQRPNNTSGRTKYYSRVEELNILNEAENIETNLTPKKQAYIAGALGMFSFLNPTYSLLAEEFAEEEINEDNHHVFLYVDYVIPESSSTQDAVDEIQSELQEMWDSGETYPVLLTYHSAHQNQIKECAVYPICIYFMERAKYLCAYGITPKGEINWYKYRLDRIISQRLEILDWHDSRIPQLLREKYHAGNLPSQKTINNKLKEAWGCDFYKEKSQMVIRIEQKFHASYVEGIKIHEQFNPISYEKAEKIINQYTRNLEHRKAILKTLQSRPNTDAYYCIDYRIADYSVLRWLRANGSKVEVLFPWELRQEMAQEIQNTYNLYQN